MSTIARYRKPGGFKQLLLLIEASGRKKQDQLLSIVRKENPLWADALCERLLTIDKVFSWSGEAIEKVISNIPEQTWVQAFFHLPESERSEMLGKVTQFLSNAKQRQIHDLLQVSQPSAGEVEAAQLMIIKKVRDLQAAKDFRPQDIDPRLALDDLENDVM